MTCPLCGVTNAVSHFDCFRCLNCDLIFKSSEIHLSPRDEKWRYEQHQNHDSPEYRNFLAKTFNAIKSHITSDSVGLDFGSGSQPIMEAMVTEMGFKIKSYDPFFLDDSSLLENTYDYILCSEVVEHFYYPAIDFAKINRLLKSSAYLSISTKAPPQDFANWYYKRDPTHVAFYGKRTMEWIAKNWSWSLVHQTGDISVFRKMRK